MSRGDEPTTPNLGSGNMDDPQTPSRFLLLPDTCQILSMISEGRERDVAKEISLLNQRIDNGLRHLDQLDGLDLSHDDQVHLYEKMEHQLRTKEKQISAYEAILEDIGKSQVNKVDLSSEA
eukprot:TRINITY_DN17111_c0_g1_i1.p1 TRINITY_DN17111_c0_g1~~TRINITY_DN17111_c0_g1_i1.p1  ORF type:complete len:121 (+),score=20.88 TRINITY_DN17111_c0_g1_i1:143-505(+)